jgi:hypothetical protein
VLAREEFDGGELLLIAEELVDQDDGGGDRDGPQDRKLDRRA